MSDSEDRLETAMKNVKQAKVLLSDANCAINAAQAERAELRRENERLAKQQLPEGVEWPRFEDGELVGIGDKVSFGGESLTVACVQLGRLGYRLGITGCLDRSSLSGSYGVRVKRPTSKVLDKDGVPIEVGDVVYVAGGSGKPRRVEEVTRFFVNLGKGVGSFVPSSLTHKRPDSWEKLEEDVKLMPSDYLESRGMKIAMERRREAMLTDLVRRAKALAKAGE